MGILFEWDATKAQQNIKKHGVTFDEASSAFSDPLSRTIIDPLHSVNEHRFVLIGRSCKDRLLVVVHAEKGDKLRIISAREASKRERMNYEENEE